jgi:hypothetical protein
MQVKLRVIGGKNDGREIRISVPEFIIGRGEQAHLRPNSDLVSRHHCSIKTQAGQVLVEDAGSRNGTFVNGEQVAGSRVVRPGDILRVGRLQFEMVIDHLEPGIKRPKVEGVAQAAARAASVGANDQVDEESITDWLTESGSNTSELDPKSLQDTRQFRLDETPTKLFVKSSELAAQKEAEAKKGDSKSRKLPTITRPSSEDSKTAADDVLRKFFNRR